MSEPDLVDNLLALAFRPDFSCENRPAVRRKRKLCHAARRGVLKQTNSLAARGVPDRNSTGSPDLRIVLDMADVKFVAIGCEFQMVANAKVAAQSGPFFSRGHVPELNPVGVRQCSQRPTVRRPGDLANGSFMSFERRFELRRFHGF